MVPAIVMLRFLFLRLFAQRLMALGIIMTLAFSVGVMATGPVYTDGAREFLTSSGLAAASAPVVDARVGIFAKPAFDLAKADRQVRSLASTLPVQTILTQGDGTVGIGSSAVSVPLLFRDSQDRHLRFRSGGPPGRNEIAIPSGLSWSSHIRRGDRVEVIGPGRRTSLQVSGVFDPPEPDDYWFGNESPFPIGDATVPVPVVVDPRFAPELVERLHLPIQFDWDIYLARDDISYEQARDLPAAYESFQTDVYRILSFRQQPHVESGISSVVAEIEREVRDLEVPILLVLVQILVVTLFVLAGVGVLLVARQSFELAIMHTRGVSTRSLLLTQGLQACLAAVLAWPIGIVIAGLLARFAAFTNGLRTADVSFPIRITSSALLLGAGAAAAGAVVLSLPSFAVVRRTIVDERRQASREPRPMLAKVPVELIVLPVGLFALIQLRQASQPSSSTAASIDPSLLFGPTFLVLGGSFLAIRILSVTLNALDGRIGRSRRLSSYLAGRRLARAPGSAFASAVLLALSIGLVFVSTSYRATTLRNHADVAHAFTGSDWVASVGTPAPGSSTRSARLPAGMSPVARFLPVGLAGSSSTRTTGLAVDPDTFGAAAWWRSDFGDEGLDAMLERIRVPPVGVPLPDGTSRLVLSVWTPPEAPGMSIRVSYAKVDGSVASTPTQVLSPGRADYAVDLVEGSRLLSFTFQAPTATGRATVPLAIGDVRLDGAPLSLDGWVPLHVRGASGSLGPRQGGWLFEARFGLGANLVGIEPRPPAIPAIVSGDVAADDRAVFQLRLGDQLLQVRRVATAEAFPSVPPGSPFVVVPSPTLFDLLHAEPGALAAPTEVWARGGGDPTDVIQAAGFPVAGIRSAAGVETQLAKNPESLAVGLDAAAAIAGLGLVIAGASATLYFAQRRRDFEFASLRALGAAAPSLRATVAKEQFALIGAASFAGVLVGAIAFRLATAPLLKTFAASFPPPVVVVDARSMVGGLVVIAAAATVAVAAATRALLRSSVSAVLRGDPE